MTMIARWKLLTLVSLLLAIWQFMLFQSQLYSADQQLRHLRDVDVVVPPTTSDPPPPAEKQTEEQGEPSALPSISISSTITVKQTTTTKTAIEPSQSVPASEEKAREDDSPALLDETLNQKEERGAALNNKGPSSLATAAADEKDIPKEEEVRKESSLRAPPPAAVKQEQQNENDGKADDVTLPLKRLHQNNNNRPLFIMHPGPPKTATTTLQHGLWRIRDLLLKDNYYFPGMYKMKYETTSFDALWDPKCQGALAASWQSKENAAKPLDDNNGDDDDENDDENDPLHCWNTFLRDLKELRQQGRNVIISDERLSELWRGFDKESGPGKFHWRAVKQAFEEQEWDVHVILSYRRLVDWLPSVKLQFDKMSGRGRWPRDGSKGLSGIYPHLKSLLISTRKYKNIEETLMQYQKYFPNVTIWNQAAPATRDILPAFVCDFLPNATTACEVLTRNENVKTKRSNMAQSYDYDRITTEAAGAHLFNVSRWKRGAVGDQLKRFHETTLGLKTRDFPQSCPEKADLEHLLEASLAMEERVLPDFHASALGKDVHEANFWQAVEKGKYCSVDPKAVIANVTYRNFFMGLDNDKGNSGNKPADEQPKVTPTRAAGTSPIRVEKG